MERNESWLQLARALLGEPEFDILGVTSEAKVDPEQARRLWRALGFPPLADDERAFTRRDIEMLRATTTLTERGVADAHTTVHMARVIGQALARVAEAQASLPGTRLETAAVAPATFPPGLSPDLLAVLESFLGYAWRRHLLAALLRQDALGDPADAGAAQVTVGFADMVKYTELSRRMADNELAELVDRFEDLVYEHVPEHGGRVVKMIGDEVMFVADDAAKAAEIALSLVEARPDPELPGLRVGLASGPVLAWEGDYYGPTVNLASRLVDLARPHCVLVSPATVEEVRGHGDLRLRRVPPQVIKGFGRMRVAVLRRAADERQTR
jgi:adenylate cyclase